MSQQFTPDGERVTKIKSPLPPPSKMIFSNKVLNTKGDIIVFEGFGFKEEGIKMRITDVKRIDDYTNEIILEPVEAGK